MVILIEAMPPKNIPIADYRFPIEWTSSLILHPFELVRVERLGTPDLQSGAFAAQPRMPVWS